MTKILEELKAQIKRLEGRPRQFATADKPVETPWRFGIAALDAALPHQSIGFDACHDFTPLSATDVPHVAGFLLALLQRLPRNGPVVWCQTAFNAREYGRVYAPGLLGHALSPQRLLFVRVPKARDLSLVLEECVRVPQVAVVVGEGPAPDFTASRRLALAAQQSRVPCLILNTQGEIRASAAATRWRLAPVAGPSDPLDPQGPGHAAWRLTLARARGADAALNPTLAKPLTIYWDNKARCFSQISSSDAKTEIETKKAYQEVRIGN